MSSSEAKSVRRPALGPVANLSVGLLTLIGGSVLLYSFGAQALYSPLRGGVEAVALAMIVLGLTMTGASLRPALRSLRTFGPANRAGSVGAQGEQRHRLASDRVAFRLFEPAGPYVDLTDAVRRAYAETQGTAAATFANAFGADADDIATMYATFFAEHVPIHGCRRPTDLVEQVSLTNPPKEFRVEDGTLILKECDGDGVFSELKICASDYALVLSRIFSAPE